MANITRESLTELAEGNPARAQQKEPNAAQKTATTPAVIITERPCAKTGNLPAVSMTTAEGAESSDNHEGKLISKKDDEETHPASPQARAELAVAAKLGRKPNVLIVEDTAELAEVIQATLENRGMNVHWVSHGSKGIERIKTVPELPDVLLLDIGLPDMTGWKMLEELREWKKNPDDLPAVVVITAFGDPANRLIGKLQGIHSYLIKPFTADEVERVVQGALSTPE